MKQLHSVHLVPTRERKRQHFGPVIKSSMRISKHALFGCDLLRHWHALMKHGLNPKFSCGFGWQVKGHAKGSRHLCLLMWLSRPQNLRLAEHVWKEYELSVLNHLQPVILKFYRKWLFLSLRYDDKFTTKAWKHFFPQQK